MHREEVERSGEAGQCPETGWKCSDTWPSFKGEAAFPGESDVTNAKV